MIKRVKIALQNSHIMGAKKILDISKKGEYQQQTIPTNLISQGKKYNCLTKQNVGSKCGYKIGTFLARSVIRLFRLENS